MEHDYWRGPQYCTGIHGVRFAIVGYSHYWQTDDRDTEDFTQYVIEKQVIGKECSIAFFNSIASYFDRDLDFWNDVIFFNFIPNGIGPSAKKFARGTPDQVKAGRERALRIFAAHKPSKVLVFSSKGWREFPPTIEENSGRGTKSLGDNFPPKFRRGTYAFDGHSVQAFGLRHPQGAKAETMRRAVRSILFDH